MAENGLKWPKMRPKGLKKVEKGLKFGTFLRVEFVNSFYSMT
jgi:hypothetical protein